MVAETMRNSEEVAERSTPWSRVVDMSFGDTVSYFSGIGWCRLLQTLLSVRRNGALPVSVLKCYYEHHLRLGSLRVWFSGRFCKLSNIHKFLFYLNQPELISIV